MGANEFKHVGLLPIEYRVEQLMLGHMFNIINGKGLCKVKKIPKIQKKMG